MHGIFIYNYILLFIIVFDLSLKISGTIGLAGRQSSPFTPGERILKAQREGLQDAPFVLSKNAKKLIVDFGNSLPITKNGSHNVTFIDQLLVAVPKRPANDIKPVSCAEDLLFLGVVLYRIENWYTNSAGVQSFPPIGVLSDEEIERLENTPPRYRRGNYIYFISFANTNDRKKSAKAHSM